MTGTIRVESVAGKVDFAVITIRPDEYKAVLDRLESRLIVVGGASLYEFATIYNANGERVTVLVGRTSGQGHNAAQQLAKNIVCDVSPRWLVLVGIAGGFPSDDFSLGDVLIASRIIDLSVHAINHGGEIEFSPSGGPLHPDVQNLVDLLPGRGSMLGPWNEKQSLYQEKPRVVLPKSPRDDALTGDDDDYKEKLISSLGKHFSRARGPLFHPACLATSNTLVKSTKLVGKFKMVARDIEHVEMEAGGVYFVSREGTPLLSVRGISDIVGWKRDGAWTQFACNSAAAFFVSLITNFPRSVFGNSLATPTVLPTGDPNIAPEDRLQIIDLKREMQRVSSWLLQYELDEAERIDFAVEEDLIELDEKQPVSLLLGPPGSGKTCLLAKVGNRFAELGKAVFAIKADLFPHDKKTMIEWASTELLIGLDFFELVETVAARETVVVLIDQLDALANTVDLTSSRLNEILSFIDKCREIPNVFVISSCRSFDYFYDSRFRRLTPKTHDLSSPTWEQASEKLRSAGIKPEHIQPKLRELLRTPQNLSIFTRLKSRSTAKTFETYSEMLGELWNYTVTTADEINFISRLTAKLVATESIWTPLAAIQFEEAVVSRLCSEGLLERRNNQLRFSHQTVHEYAVARLFAESEVSLSDFVATHQDTVFKRPTIWAVLSYLRDVAKERYASEFDLILRAAPRAHLKFLLVDFVCRQRKPTEYEVSVIGEWLADEVLRLRILSAINNNPAWFQAFKHSHLPSIMNDPRKEQWPLVSVLMNAWSFDWDGAFTLIKEHWSKHSEFYGMTLQVLERCAKWTPEVLSLIERVSIRMKHSHRRSYQIESIVGVISLESPDDAARLAARVISTSSKQESEVKTLYKSPLESGDGWYDLEEIAKAAPAVFLDEITPWFVAIAEEYHNNYGGAVLAHYAGSCLSLDNLGYSRESTVLTAIQACVSIVSKLSPEKFVRLFRRHWNSENAVVHRIFIEGLMNVVGSCSEDVFGYLMSDDRRFTVGPYRDTQESRSVQLIKRLVPHLNEEQRIQLIEKIQKWSKYRSEVDPCESQLVRDRESRLHLLNAIPLEFRSDALCRFIESEKISLPNWDREPPRGHSGWVKTIPPMEAVQMETAHEDKLIEAFSSKTSRRGEWIEVEGCFEEYGGGEAAADELSKLSKSNPSRAAEVIRLLVSRGVTTNIHRSLGGFATIEDRDLVFSLIRDISVTCDDNEEFRSAASYVLRAHCNDDGLPEVVIALLDAWLAKSLAFEANEAVEPDKAVEGVAREWRPDASLLWTPDAFTPIDGQGSYNTLLALTQCLLSKNNPQGDRWISILARHLDRQVSYKTWRAFVGRLRYVGAPYCSPELGKSLVAKLFAKFPQLASEADGCRLLGRLARFLNPEFFCKIFDYLTQSNDEFEQQAAGELITLCALLDETSDWGLPVLEARLFAAEGPPAAFQVGVAHATSSLWGELNKPKECSRILTQVIGFGNANATDAIGRLFRNDVALPADEQTSSILKKLTEQIESVSGGLAEDVLCHLTSILPHLKSEILSFAHQLVETRFAELRRREFNAYEVGPYLVEIAMTLQRFDETRSKSLHLFEKLLSAGLDEANKALKDIDEVEEISEESPRTPRRRRRQSRKRNANDN